MGEYGLKWVNKVGLKMFKDVFFWSCGVGNLGYVSFFWCGMLFGRGSWGEWWVFLVFLFLVFIVLICCCLLEDLGGIGIWLVVLIFCNCFFSCKIYLFFFCNCFVFVCSCFFFDIIFVFNFVIVFLSGLFVIWLLNVFDMVFKNDILYFGW